MQLVTERLVLREFREEDAEAANRYERDPEVVRYQSNDVRTVEESREYLRKSMASAAAEPRRVFDLAVCLEEKEQYVGRVGMAMTEGTHPEAMLWYVLDPAHQGHGYVTEAARALLDFAFDELGLHRVYVDIDPRNKPSIRVAERLGMRHEAHLRENAWIKGEWTDTLYLAILDREWNALRAARTVRA